MKDRCIEAVSLAIGRDITKAEAEGIEARIKRTLRFVAGRDPEGFRELSPDDRLKAAAQLAGQEIVQDAQLKRRRIALSIQAHDRVQNFLAEAKKTGLDGLEALERMMVVKPDFKSNTLSAETRTQSIRMNALRQLIDTFEAVDPRLWGLFESQEGVKQLTRAIFGEKTGNAKIDKGAEAWKKVAGELRSAFNEAGGKIGLLENWSVPQHHSSAKVGKAGAEKWAAEVFPMLDRSRYLNEDGTRMGDADVMAMLNEAHMSIATGGINGMTPGATGVSMLANRRAFHREIHFKNADAYLDYQAKYGDKSLWGVMTGHVEQLSREIGSLETFGPNPDAAAKLFIERELQGMAVRDPKDSAKLQARARRLSNLYDFISGNTKPVVNEHLAQGFDTLRNWLVASRLGSAVITALTDEATLHLTAKVNNLPEMQLLQNELAAMNPANKTEEHLAHRAGIAVDTMLSHLNRWGQDNLGPTFSSKMANTVMRASGLEALDGARKRAFGVTMMSALGEVSKKYDGLHAMDPTDARMLTSKGVTPTDFAIWKSAELEQWGAGNGVLTPESIMRIPQETIDAAVQPIRDKLMAERAEKIAGIDANKALDEAARAKSIEGWSELYDDQIAKAGENARRDALLRLLGVVGEETDMAVIRPGLSDKFMTGEGMQRGTWKGELARSFFQFKAFPLSMISRHWMRGWGGMETAGGRAAYLGSLIAGTTILGAVAQSISDVLAGKDPRTYNPFQEHGMKDWLAAFLKGGSLGLYGDFLFSGATQHSQTGPLAALMGPSAGLVEEVFHLTQGNLVKVAQGQKTQFGGDLVQFIKGNTPGASLWYAKAALDHVVFQQLQEYFSPGYLATMQRRAQKDFGQSFWWAPGSGPEGMRAPDLAKVTGG